MYMHFTLYSIIFSIWTGDPPHSLWATSNAQQRRRRAKRMLNSLLTKLNSGIILDELNGDIVIDLNLPLQGYNQLDEAEVRL